MNSASEEEWFHLQTWEWMCILCSQMRRVQSVV